MVETLSQVNDENSFYPRIVECTILGECSMVTMLYPCDGFMGHDAGRIVSRCR
jgi:hypothetical protein